MSDGGQERGRSGPSGTASCACPTCQNPCSCQCQSSCSCLRLYTVACFPVHAFQCMPVSPRPRPRCWTRVLRSALTHQGHRQLAPALRRLIPFSSASVPAAVRPSPWTRRLCIFNDNHQTKSNRTCAKTSILTETVIPLPQEAIPPAIAPIIIRVGRQRSN